MFYFKGKESGKGFILTGPASFVMMVPVMKRESILHALPDTIYLISKDGIFLEVQANDEQDLFAPASEMIGKNLDQVLSTDLADQFLYYLQKAIQTKNLQICEYQLSRMGQNSLYQIEYFEARFHSCDLDQILIVIRNITEKKQTENQFVQMMVELEESHDNMLSVLNQLRLGTAMTDRDGRITFVSKSCLKLLNASEADVLRKNWHAAFPFAQADIAKLISLCEISPKKREKIPIHFNENTWVEIEVKDEPRDPLKKIFILYDVTELHALRRILDERSRFYDLIGRSKSMQLVYDQIHNLASVDSTVLIQGETGTGKELVARALHNASHRKQGPFIAVNCAGLTNDSLLMSQLFGHRKGSFTGAFADQKGLLEAAHRGTLFLDEIGDVPHSVQVSLLRFLQEREIVRLGETRARKVDVRVVVASQHDLQTLVKEGRFRADLFYRICVASIFLPALRERRDDIPLLANQFLINACASLGKSMKEITPETMKLLAEYNWPGNVRELMGAIESAVIQSPCEHILPEHFSKEIQQKAKQIQNESEDYFENQKTRFQNALKQTGGNRTAAAKVLGISRATFYRKMNDSKIGGSPPSNGLPRV